MKVNGIDVQSSDRSSSTKPLDRQLLGDGAKDLTIKVKVLALQLEVLDALFGLFLFSHVVLKTPHLATARASRDDVAIGLEKRPQQVVRDLAFSQERVETLRGGL